MDVFESTAGLKPLTGRVDSAPSPLSLRTRVLVGDGDGERDLPIQDFRARVEIGPVIEGALRSVLCVFSSLRVSDSSARSCAKGSGPMVNVDMVSGLSRSFCRLLGPSRLIDLLDNFNPSSGPFFVEA